MNLRRRLLGSVIIPAVLAGMMTPVASAQTAEQIPSVSVRPVGTGENDPNGGQWFVASMNPGETKRLEARIYNPATVPQKVDLYLAGMRFNDNGTVEVTNTPTDVGTWGKFERDSTTIGPRETTIEAFEITVPKGVDPGDHIGAVVFEHSAVGEGNILTLRRVAVRLYVSLPGDARRDFVIDGVTTKKDSWFFTRDLDINVRLRNTGGVRLETTVHVDGKEAVGSELLMSKAAENYEISRAVNFWGGPVRLVVQARTRSLGLPGPARQLRVTVWVIPWHLLALVALIVAIAFGLRLLMRRRGRKYRALQADMRRIERLLAQQNGHPEREVQRPSGVQDREAAIRMAIKQAKRAGDLVTAERLERLST